MDEIERKSLLVEPLAAEVTVIPVEAIPIANLSRPAAVFNPNRASFSGFGIMERDPVLRELEIARQVGRIASTSSHYS